MRLLQQFANRQFLRTNRLADSAVRTTVRPTLRLHRSIQKRKNETLCHLLSFFTLAINRISCYNGASLVRNRKNVMPKIVSLAVGFAFLLVHLLQAQETPAFIEITGHTIRVNSVAFSPDGKKVVTASDKFVRIWDVETGSAAFGKELQKLEGHTSAVWSVAFSSDGKKIVSGSSFDNTARIWDVESGEELQKLETPLFSAPLFSAVFSPDGKKVLGRVCTNQFGVFGQTTGQNGWFCATQNRSTCSQKCSFGAINSKKPIVQTRPNRQRLYRSNLGCRNRRSIEKFGRKNG
jgi:WD40 repeat protein